MIAISSNAAKVAADLRAYIQETGMEDGKAVAMASKQVTRDLLQMTPPIASLSPHESFAIQRQVGVKAVQRDLRRAFTPLNSLKVMTDPRSTRIQDNVRNAINKGDTIAIATLLTKLNYLDVTSDRIVAAATPALHDELRKKGRVPPKTRGYFVIDEHSVSQLQKLRVEALGRAKSGWMAAAIVLNVSAPGWITRHGAPGGAIDLTPRFVDPSFTAHNGVLYLYDFAQENRLVELALGRVAGSLERQLQAKRLGLWNKSR